MAPGGREARPLLPVGYEPGRLLQPVAFALGDDDIFAVLDAPNGVPRVQYFGTDGTRIGGFFLPFYSTSRLVADGEVVRGLSSIAFTGRTFLVNEPAWGSLVTELDTSGKMVRQIGALRATGRENDAVLHQGLNAGMAVVDRTGAIYFVFQTGVPMFRKYSPGGTLLYERHIEGTEIDERILRLPTTWPVRAPGDKPVVTPLVRTAAIDGAGQLWVSLQVPYTYVYSRDGDKVRVVQFQGASTLAASHLFFQQNGRVIVTPGGYEFEAGDSAAPRSGGGAR